MKKVKVKAREEAVGDKLTPVHVLASLISCPVTVDSPLSIYHAICNQIMDEFDREENQELLELSIALMPGLLVIGGSGERQCV